MTRVLTAIIVSLLAIAMLAPVALGHSNHEKFKRTTRDDIAALEARVAALEAENEALRAFVQQQATINGAVAATLGTIWEGLIDFDGALGALADRVTALEGPTPTPTTPATPTPTATPSPPPTPTPTPTATATPTPPPSPTPSPPPTPTPTSTPTSTPTATPTPAPTVDPQVACRTMPSDTAIGDAPTITNITVTVPSSTTAVVSWNVSPPATGQVAYRPVGTSTWSLTNFEDETLGFHRQNIRDLTPGTTYEYRVCSSVPDGMRAVSP